MYVIQKASGIIRMPFCFGLKNNAWNRCCDLTHDENQTIHLSFTER